MKLRYLKASCKLCAEKAKCVVACAAGKWYKSKMVV